MENTSVLPKKELLYRPLAASNIDEARRLIAEFVDSVCELGKANRLTGIWDNRRFQLCKRPFDQIDSQFLYKTEKLSRKNVELRAKYRIKLDQSFKGLIDLYHQENHAKV